MAGGGRSLLVVLLIASLSQSVFATTYIVGDTKGWVIPSTTTFYDNWASKQTFVVGDKLTFTFSAGHNVYIVSEADANACDGTNPFEMHDTSATLELSAPGKIGFICQIAGHCDFGMKVVVEVQEAGVTPAPVKPPTKAPSKTPPTSMAPEVTPAAAPMPIVSLPPLEAPSAASGLRSGAALVTGVLAAVGAAVWM